MAKNHPHVVLVYEKAIEWHLYVACGPFFDREAAGVWAKTQADEFNCLVVPLFTPDQLKES